MDIKTVFDTNLSSKQRKLDILLENNVIERLLQVEKDGNHPLKIKILKY